MNNPITVYSALESTGSTHYLAHLGLPDKGRAIIWLFVCNDWDKIAFGPAERSWLLLLSTIP